MAALAARVASRSKIRWTGDSRISRTDVALGRTAGEVTEGAGDGRHRHSLDALRGRPTRRVRRTTAPSAQRPRPRPAAADDLDRPSHRPIGAARLQGPFVLVGRPRPATARPGTRSSTPVTSRGWSSSTPSPRSATRRSRSRGTARDAPGTRRSATTAVVEGRVAVRRRVRTVVLTAPRFNAESRSCRPRPRAPAACAASWQRLASSAWSDRIHQMS